MRELIIKEIKYRLFLIRTGRSRAGSDDNLLLRCELYLEDLSLIRSKARLNLWLEKNYGYLLTIIAPSHLPKFTKDLALWKSI